MELEGLRLKEVVRRNQVSERFDVPGICGLPRSPWVAVDCVYLAGPVVHMLMSPVFNQHLSSCGQS